MPKKRIVRRRRFVRAKQSTRKRAPAQTLYEQLQGTVEVSPEKDTSQGLGREEAVRLMMAQRDQALQALLRRANCQKMLKVFDEHLDVLERAIRKIMVLERLAHDIVRAFDAYGHRRDT